MTEIIPHIGYHLFPTRMIRWGWSFEDFLKWLPLHPSVKVAPIEEMGAYWRGRELTRAWQPLIAGLRPAEKIPEEWSVSAYPGRKRRFTYQVKWDVYDEEGRLLEPGVTSVTSDVTQSPEEVLATARERFRATVEKYNWTTADWTIEYVEDVEYGR